MSAKRFRIAFSFAGEKRNFVEMVARILAKRFGEAAILYDKFHEAEFARYDLGIYLPKYYREQSDLMVAVFSPDYDKKRWTGWEWMAIHAQLTKQEGSKVMLARFKYANPDGLFENAAFVELDDKTPEQLATLILQRLARNEGLPKDHYCGGQSSHLPRDVSVTADSQSVQIAAPVTESPALRAWRHKLEFLHTEEATCADPEQKFRLKQLIAEAKAKISELGGKP